MRCRSRAALLHFVFFKLHARNCERGEPGEHDASPTRGQKHPSAIPKEGKEIIFQKGKTLFFS